MPDASGPDRSDDKRLLYEAARNAFALKMAALHDLSLELSTADGVDELCRRAVLLGHRVLGYDRIGIWFVDEEDSSLLHGSFGTDESGRLRDERGVRFRRSDESIPPGFYEGKEPVYYLGSGPCFDDRHQVVGEAERALALVWDGHKVIGEIWVDNLVTRRSIDGGSIELLVRFARIVGYLTNFKRAQAELLLLSSTDLLTGVVNARTAIVVLEKQLALAARKNDELAVMYCDLDRFKQVSDEGGRAAEDEYVRMVASALASSVRDSDTVGRLGGDEFIVVLPDCDAEGAAAIDARFEAALMRTRSEASSKGLVLAVSRGIALLSDLAKAGKARSAHAIVELAEARMHEGRRAK